MKTQSSQSLDSDQISNYQLPKQTSQKQQNTKQTSAQQLIPLMFSIRFILSIFLLRNYDQPDEYWQGPQIAHYLVFGYGYRTWEWSMQKPIRNHAWPLFLSIPYRILDYFDLDNTVLIFYAPKLLQIFVGVIFDYFLLKINTIYNPGTTSKILILNYTSWFSLTIISRTYIQSFEATLTLMAFYIWNLRKVCWRMDYLSRSIAIVTFVLRSTSIMFWAVIWPYELLKMQGSRKDKVYFIIKNIITVCLMVGAAVFFEYLWRGQFTFIEYNFIHYNILLKWSQFYGAQPTLSFFYFYLPFVLGGSLPFFYYGVVKILSVRSSASRSKQSLIQSMLIMVLLSTSSHKQSRFLTIILPIYLMICVKGYTKVKQIKGLFILSILTNLIIFSVYNVYGCDGSIKVLQDIRQDKQVESILFLTSCHFTPMYSNFHHNVPIRFPDCSPLNRAKAVDQNALYHSNATKIYEKMLEDFKDPPPSHLVIEGNALKRFNVPRKEYEMISEYRNSLLVEDIFVGGNSVSLWRRKVKGKETREQNNKK